MPSPLRRTALLAATASVVACAAMLAAPHGWAPAATTATGAGAGLTGAVTGTATAGSGAPVGWAALDPAVLGAAIPDAGLEGGLPGPDGAAGTSAADLAATTGTSARYLTHVATRDRVVFLTIDDGLVPDARFLRYVRTQHLPVTVFLTNRVTHLPSTLAYFRALHAAGAVIEDHTLSHPVLTRVDPRTQQHEICGAAQRDKVDYGRRALLLRAPYGVYDARVLATAHACGIRAVVGWNAVMPQTGRLQTVLGHGRLSPGDIVIMHFLPGLADQVTALQRDLAAQHLRLALLEDYVLP